MVTKVLMFDRLCSLYQTKDDGEEVFQGAEDAGACKLKLVEAQFGDPEGAPRRHTSFLYIVTIN